MKALKSWLLAGMTLAVAIGSLISGCESSNTSDMVIVVTPATATLSAPASNTVFTAMAADTNNLLNLPLIWSVSDTNLGKIASSAGVTAVYASTGNVGDNIVTVSDQGGAAGQALVTQR